jgi:hypothetical protein
MYSLCLCLKEGNHGMHLPDTAWKIWEEEEEKEEEEVLIASRCMCVSLQFCAVVSSTAGANFFGEILEWTGFAIDPWVESGWIRFEWPDMTHDQWIPVTVWLVTKWKTREFSHQITGPSLVIGPLTEQGLTLKENEGKHKQQDITRCKNAHDSLESHLSPFRVHFNFIPTDWLC